MAKTPDRNIKSITGTGQTAWLPLDIAQTPFCASFAAVVTGTVAYSIEHTYDDVYDATVTPTAFTNALGTGLTTNKDGSYLAPITGIRVNVASGTGTVVLTAIQGRGN